MSQQVQRKSSAPGSQNQQQQQQQQQQPLTAFLGALMPFQRSGKSHSTSCVPNTQSASQQQQQQQSPNQLQPRLPTTPPKLLVSSTDESSAAATGGSSSRQATFHFPSGVCQNESDDEDDCNYAEEGNDDADDDEAGDDDEKNDYYEVDGACCRGEGSSPSAASLTAPGGERRSGQRGGGRPDIQRCHSDSGAEATPAHALFLRQRGISQKTQDDADILPGSGVYDGEDGSCHKRGHQHHQHQPQQQQQQQQLVQNSQQQQQQQHHRIWLSFGPSGSSSERKEKSKKRSIGDKFSFLSRKSVEATSADKASGIKPSCDQVQRWGASFDSLLNDKYGLALFRAFLKTEYSDENIEFWIACEEYRSLAGPKKQTMKAQKIYNEFVAFQAPREVNLDSTTRLATINAMGSPDGHLFEQAQKRIQALMEKDSYQRFLRSEVYQNHLRDTAKTNVGSSSSTLLGGH